MTWVFDDKLPIYLQIIQILKADIARGKYQTGEKLPAVRELALPAGVNPNHFVAGLPEGRYSSAAGKISGRAKVDFLFPTTRKEGLYE